MKFMETEFAKQMLYTVIGTLFLVANITFISLTASIGYNLESGSATTAMATYATSLNAV
jgi:hypothetical protein